MGIGAPRRRRRPVGFRRGVTCRTTDGLRIGSIARPRPSPPRVPRQSPLQGPVPGTRSGNPDPMASAASHVSFLPPVLTFCAAAVVAVPIFRLAGLSAVLGYLAAGVAIGPSGLALIEDPQTT